MNSGNWFFGFLLFSIDEFYRGDNKFIIVAWIINICVIFAVVSLFIISMNIMCMQKNKNFPLNRDHFKRFIIIQCSVFSNRTCIMWYNVYS